MAAGKLRGQSTGCNASSDCITVTNLPLLLLVSRFASLPVSGTTGTAARDVRN